ncbi:cryptochrome/photolyase family protein [Dactylosporangium vinaceum]|uniref:Cryptochrome/photolyase family protein n=1 Tax=Dactylosporangium vinaceum TaxID=53362 RepID=A0ABV5MEH0_9ACTN|nr:cryptochrome/photolyase family protein [Dactylosporangium vinaceum]UAB92401.1 cryptochrome/photolyase family protein [Dactylosporangium vinaceum]
MATRRRWLFADQLGPHFLDDEPERQVLLVVSKGVFRRKVYHRQKAHLVLSALRHRAAELGDRAELIVTERYRDAVTGPVEVCHPTSRAARELIRSLPDATMLPPRGFITAPGDFVRWADGRPRLLLEDFYRDARRRHGILMDGSEPAGGRWNFDGDNREPPPRGVRTLGVPPPPALAEDDVDAEVRAELDRWERDDGIRFIGRDGPRRFAVTAGEAQARLAHFLEHRLPVFGPHEDAMLREDPLMAHSLLSASLNLGLLDPLDVVERAEGEYRRGAAPIAGVEGFVRQILGWRDYVWHCYWYFGPRFEHRDALHARRRLPAWFAGLDPEGVGSACLRDVLTRVRDTGWVHHIQRLMVLGNLALQRDWHPADVADWFARAFVDGYPWVMTPNVIGMSQYADGGRMTTKPYAAGGAYINRMSDYCGGCPFDPKHRAGADACPFTAGYWAFLHHHRDAFAGNHRMRQPLALLDRLADAAEIAAAESRRRDF